MLVEKHLPVSRAIALVIAGWTWGRVWCGMSWEEFGNTSQYGAGWPPITRKVRVPKVRKVAGNLERPSEVSLILD